MRFRPTPIPPSAANRAPLALFLLVLSAAFSLGAEGGRITGRIINAATGDFIRNAEVGLADGSRSTVSGEDGSYGLADIPPGTVTVEARHTGYRKATATLTVAAGATASQDLSLASSAAPAAEVVQLGQFVVAGEREGNAKAIMEQRNSMNITNSVASDVFGDVAEGNAAEFLKNIPGVDLFLVQGEIVNVRLRGLGAEYNSVTIDGVRLASADANKGAAGDAEKADAIRMLVRDASERWTKELKASIDRLTPLQKDVEAAWREPVTLAETQRRLRLAVAELDAARSRLQLIEDPALVQAAAVAELPRTDPLFERLRLERATEFAGLGWSVLPVQTLFELDREATIDLPTVIEELELSAASRSVADMALVDAAVPLIENAEALRQACVQALRGLVLEIKRAQLQGVSDLEMGPVALKAVKAGAGTVAVPAETRMRQQRELMMRIADALPPADTRQRVDS